MVRTWVGLWNTNMDWDVFLMDNWNMFDNWIRLWNAFQQCNGFHSINVTTQKMFSVSVAMEIMMSLSM